MPLNSALNTWIENYPVFYNINMRGALTPRSSKIKTMKNQNQTPKKMRFMDYIFALFCVFLFFGLFPRDYQTNAPTVFALCSVLVFQFSLRISIAIRILSSQHLYGNDNTNDRYMLSKKYDLKPILCYIHVPVFIIFMILIA